MIHHLKKYLVDNIDALDYDRVFIDDETIGAGNEYTLMSHVGGKVSTWQDFNSEASIQIMNVGEDREPTRDLANGISLFISDKCDFILDNPFEGISNVTNELNGRVKVLSIINTSSPYMIQKNQRGYIFTHSYFIKYKHRILEA